MTGRVLLLAGLPVVRPVPLGCQPSTHLDERVVCRRAMPEQVEGFTQALGYKNNDVGNDVIR